VWVAIQCCRGNCQLFQGRKGTTDDEFRETCVGEMEPWRRGAAHVVSRLASLAGGQGRKPPTGPMKRPPHETSTQPRTTAIRERLSILTPGYFVSRPRSSPAFVRFRDIKDL
jgi:hypothetical protein